MSTRHASAPCGDITSILKIVAHGYTPETLLAQLKLDPERKIVEVICATDEAGTWHHIWSLN